MSEIGFEIKGQFFPWIPPDAFTLGDTVLIEKVTGLDWPSFAERLPDEDDDPSRAEDAVLNIGFVAVAIWHLRPQWRRDRVAAYVEKLAIHDVTLVVPDEEGDADPPAPAPATAADQSENESKTSPSPSNDTAATESDETSQTASGALTSATGSPA